LRKQYGRLKGHQAKRLNVLGFANSRLQRVVAERTVDALILEVVAAGKR
jgi:hypothetical protein